MKLYIKDDYVFYYADWTWQPINVTINTIAKYLQDNWFWNTFEWELEITEVIPKGDLNL